MAASEQYRCDVCNIPVSGYENLKQHKAGRLHKNKLKIVGHRSVRNHIVIPPPSPIRVDRHICVISSLDDLEEAYHCRLCNVSFTRGNALEKASKHCATHVKIL